MYRLLGRCNKEIRKNARSIRAGGELLSATIAVIVIFVIKLSIFCPFVFSHWKLPETSVCIPCVSEVLMVMRALHVMHSRYRRASLSNVALRVYGAVDTGLHHSTRVVICELVEFGTA